MKLKLIIAILSVNITVSLSQTNILESYNGDFENGLNSWRVFEDPEDYGSFAEVTSDAVSGDYAMKVNYSTDYGQINDRGFDNWMAQVPAKPDLIYELKAYVKGDPNSLVSFVKARFTIGFTDASGNIVKQRSALYPINDVYAEKSLSQKAPSDAVYCFVVFRLFDAIRPCRPFRSMYIDDVRLLEPWLTSIESPHFTESETIALKTYPNPFKSETIISYELNSTKVVSLKIYDILGQEVAVLLTSKTQNAGTNKVSWAPNGLSNGVYFYRLEVLSESGAKTIFNEKMVLGR